MNTLASAPAKRSPCQLLIQSGGHTVSTFLAACGLHRRRICMSLAIIGSGPSDLAGPRS
jgi:hypothetical protein